MKNASELMVEWVEKESCFSCEALPGQKCKTDWGDQGIQYGSPCEWRLVIGCRKLIEELLGYARCVSNRW